MHRSAFASPSQLTCRRLPVGARRTAQLLSLQLLLAGATSCGARTALESGAYGEGNDRGPKGEETAANGAPHTETMHGDSTADTTLRASTTQFDETLPGETPSNTAPNDASSLSPNPLATTESSSSGESVAPLQDPSEYTLPFVVVGKPQSESSLYHPLPTDETLGTTIAWLEEGEGLPYPLRYLEWRLLGERKGEVLAVGPTDEIYVQPYNIESQLIERYTPGYGWATETIHVKPDGTDVAVTAMSVTSDGVAWAATDTGLFVRNTAGQWSSAVGWDMTIGQLDGADFGMSRTDGVAFHADGVFTTNGNGVWTPIDRSLPLLLPNTAYQRKWLGFRANGEQLLGHSNVDVIWLQGSGERHAYPIRARDVGFGATGERLVLGKQELLVSDNVDAWRVYPIQIGGHRGGASFVDNMAVTTLGDAYVSGLQEALFHRFMDGSMEYLNAPGTHDRVAANASIVVVRDAVGVWQATPRATAHTSGVFEAVIPRTYGTPQVMTTLDKVELPFSVEPPPCFDIDLDDTVGNQLAFVNFEPRKRLRFRAPESGTFQFRVDWTTASGNVATYPARLSATAECEPTSRAEGNPLQVALSAGQYVIVEASSEPNSVTGELEAPGGWLSIR